MIFEGLSGKLITAILRPGKTPSGRENAGIIKRLLTLIRQSWPKTHLIIRGDSHFAQPELMQVVEQDKAADYVLGKGAGHPTALRRALQGHMNYFSVPGNGLRVNAFRTEVQKIWYKALKRRSQRNRLNWKKFGAFINTVLPKVKVLHPWPEQRFDVKHSR